MKAFLLGTLLYLTLGIASSNAQTLSGTVSSSSGPVVGAHIILNEGSYASFTNEEGLFRIDNIELGSYRIVVSAIGFSDYKSTIEVSSKENISIKLTEVVYESEVAVITATRTKKLLEDVSIPVQVIDDDEVTATGANTLADILVEQAGIALSPNESSAIQIQGFESDYTLVLIDDQPVIGRTRGALDLSRINISNIQQIELVKGPSSALWGSDAFAGVINIITKKPQQPLSVSVFSEYGSRNTHNSGMNLGFRKGKLSGQINGSVDGSDGFDLSSKEYGNNQNPYTNYSLNSSLSADLSEKLSLNSAIRYARNTFSGPTIASLQGQTINIEEEGWQDEQSFTIEAKLIPFKQFNATFTGFLTRYEDYSTTLFENPADPEIVTNNQQGLNRIEVQNNYLWKFDHITTLGGGLTSEFVEAERYSGKRTQSGSFLYLQHQAYVNEDFNFTAGARLDNHSTYDSYLSPKLSAQYKLGTRLTLRASVGRGFKAPDFRTLYLNFDNAGSSYRVIGTLNIEDFIFELERDGRINRYFVNPNQAFSLSPEYSTSFNAGADFEFSDNLFFKTNFFRNNAKNLIDAVSIAELNDGTELFGYININEAYTQGIESELGFEPSNDLRITAGYQYLKAVQVQQDTLTVLENGLVINKAVEIENPLAKRPKHTGTFKIFYSEPFSKIDFSLRVQIRSKYFFNDNNANRKADENEFAPGYSIWNLALSRNFSNKIRMQIGIDNFTNHTNSEFLRYQPGITYFGKIFLTLN